MLELPKTVDCRALACPEPVEGLCPQPSFACRLCWWAEKPWEFRSPHQGKYSLLRTLFGVKHGLMRLHFLSFGRAARGVGHFSAQLAISALALYGVAAFGQVNAPEVQLARIPVWQAHNRSILIGLDSLDRHYTEFDSFGLTSDGILNTEKGTLNGGAIRGRWQGASICASQS